MKQLLDYLKSLDRPSRAAFCERCGTSENYLRKASSIGQRLSAELAAHIDRESGGAVSRRDIRQEDWWLIWPELVTADFPIPTEPVREPADA